MKSKAFAPLLSLCLLIAGCGTVSPKSNDLVEPAHKQAFVLDQPLSTASKIGYLEKFDAEYGAIPGTFRSEREDEDGTYYFGSGRAIWYTHERLSKGLPRLLNGGIFVPRNSSDLPRYFYVFETQSVTTDNLNTYIQTRIVETTAMPALAPTGASVGSTVVGNVLAGAIVNAILEAGAGQLIKSQFPMSTSAAAQLATAMEKAKTLQDDSK